MTAAHITATDRPHSVETNSTRRTAAVLLAQFAAMWGAFFVLAPSIDWPASLDLAPADIFPLIRSNANAVMVGYTSYLIHALLLIPIAWGCSPVSGRWCCLFTCCAPATEN